MNVFSSGPRVLLVGPVPHGHKLGEYSLVLKSMEIAHGISSQPDGYYFSVDERMAERTVAVLRDYEEENRDFQPTVRRAKERLPFAFSSAAPVLMALLGLFFAVTGPSSLHSPWFAAGIADSHLILRGQVWRAITALTLHGDTAHVVGNILAGSIFLSLLFRRLGARRGAFYAVVAGTVGNLANAVIHPFGHRSIGASTLVFAAVGLLAATQLRANRELGARRWTDHAGPIVGGLAILGLLGSSAHSDLWAHLLGLVSGALFGWIAVLTMPKEANRRFDSAYVFATCLLVFGAWALALAMP